MDYSWLTTTWTEIIMVLVSAIGIYLTLIIFTRLAGLRSFSKLSSFDFAITVAVGSVIATTILTENPPLIQAIIALGLLYFLRNVVAKLRRFSPFISKLVDNQPTLLMKGPTMLDENLKATKVTSDDLRAKLREANVTDLNQVKAVVLGTDNVEVFDNTIQENNVVGTGVFSYNSMIALGLAALTPDPMYNASRIYIHDNTFSRSNTYQDAGEQSFFGNLLVGSFGSNPIPDVMVDGFFDVTGGTSGSICIENNSGTSFVNLNIPDDFPNKLSIDASPHNCSMDALPAVQLNIPKF